LQALSLRPYLSRDLSYPQDLGAKEMPARSVHRQNAAIKRRVVFICWSIFLITWTLLLSKPEWTIEVLEEIPGKLFLFSVSGLFAILLGVMLYGYFYIPLTKGFLIRLHGSCLTLAVTAVSAAAFGVPDVRKIHFTAREIVVDFFQPKQQAPFIFLAIACVIGMVSCGLFYLVAERLEQLARRRPAVQFDRRHDRRDSQ
jgi:hypothetical protein